MDHVNESKEMEINSMNKLNKQILSKYNEGLFKNSESNVTKMNYMTHMSVHGLKNRFGFRNTFSNSDNDKQNKNKVDGYIYLLSGDKCGDINKEYENKTTKN